MYIYTDCMATKTISLTEEAYHRLATLKAPQESFSKEVVRLTSTRGSIMDLAGAWEDVSDKEAEGIKAAIRSMRKGTRLENIRRRMQHVG